MRPRFFAILGCPAEQRAAIAARLLPHVPLRHDAASFDLFTSEDSPNLRFARSEGVVIGTIFDQVNGRRWTEISGGLESEFVASGGDRLLRAGWGAYVVLWTDREGQSWLLRDPSACQPAYLYRKGAVCCVFSDIGIALISGLVPVTIDWEGLAEGLTASDPPGRNTALLGISEILPGQRIRLTGGSADESLRWRPWDFVQPDLEREGAGDGGALRGAIQTSVECWGRHHAPVQLELSGGLDSSILAAALAQSGVAWSCANLVTRAADGDERIYARRVASLFGKAVSELDVEAASANPLAPMSRLTPRPRGMRILAGADRLLSDSARRAGAGAIFNGAGGDNVFCFIHSTAPILDAWRAGGMRLARHILGDVALASGLTEARITALLAQRLFGWRRSDGNQRYLVRKHRVPHEIHPWLRTPKATPAGTRAHIGGIVRIHPFLDCLDRNADANMVFPLLSQPVMEACLAIPSWRWIAGGRDRAVARLAYAGRLPDDILFRRSKGRGESLVVAGIDGHLVRIRECLADGLLAGAGLLDRPALLARLSRPSRSDDADHDRLLQLVDAELWARECLASRPPTLLRRQ